MGNLRPARGGSDGRWADHEVKKRTQKGIVPRRVAQRANDVLWVLGGPEGSLSSSPGTIRNQEGGRKHY